MPAVDRFLESLLPDFVLAFAFFAALCLAVLARRFGAARPAAAMSASLRLALASGLVWWENDHGWSVRDLGPVAVLTMVTLMAIVIYQAVRQTAGSWAGSGMAIAAGLFVAMFLNEDWPVAEGIVASVATVALLVGCLALITRLGCSQTRASASPRSASPVETVGIRRDLGEAQADRRLGAQLRRGLTRVRHEADWLSSRPQERTDVMLQLRRILPAEGSLTARLAQLRERAHHLEQGHAGRIHELRHAARDAPREMRKRLSAELASRYRELDLDRRLERLDRAAADVEIRIRRLTREAERAVANYAYRDVVDLLLRAERLQKHNQSLLRSIARTEQKLRHVAKQAAREVTDA